MKRFIFSFIPFIVVFFLWEIVATVSPFESYILPRPSRVLVVFWQLLIDGPLIHHILLSLQNAVIGLVVGVLLALLVAAACAVSAKVYDFFMPLVSAAYPVPTIVWVPLSLLWFGFSSMSLIFVVALGCFFAMFYNVLIGLRSIDGKYILAAKNLKLNRYRYFVEIVLLAGLSHFLSGLRLAVGQSWRIIIGAEMLASTVKGLGYFLWISHEFFKYEQIFVGIIAIGIIGFLLEKLLFEWIEQKTIRQWY